jgi:hypothetical protein
MKAKLDLLVMTVLSGLPSFAQGAPKAGTFFSIVRIFDEPPRQEEQPELETKLLVEMGCRWV